MNKMMLRFPEIMQQRGRHTPNAVAAFFIALLVYFVHAVLLLIGILIYSLSNALNSGFSSMLNPANSLLNNQGIVLFALFMTATLIILCVVYVRGIEKRPLSAMGLTHGKSVSRYAIGFGLGVGVLLIFLVPALLIEKPEFVGFRPIALLYLLAFVVQGASEEIFFRGMVMPSLARRIPALWAVVVSSAMFSLFHVGSAPASVLYFTYIFMMGAVFALYTLRTGSLVGACAIHTAWNFTLGLGSVIEIGPITADYAVFRMPESTNAAIDYGVVGDPSTLLLIALMMVAAALLLFAGKNRLAVRVTQEEWMLRKAERIAYRIRRGRLRGGSRLDQAFALSDTLTTKADKTVALLAGADRYSRYSPQRLIDSGFSGEVCGALETLVWRDGEDLAAHSRRAADDPIARRVMIADLQYVLGHADPGKMTMEDQQRQGDMRSALEMLMRE